MVDMKWTVMQSIWKFIDLHYIQVFLILIVILVYLLRDEFTTSKPTVPIIQGEDEETELIQICVKDNDTHSENACQYDLNDIPKIIQDEENKLNEICVEVKDKDTDKIKNKNNNRVKLKDTDRVKIRELVYNSINAANRIHISQFLYHKKIMTSYQVDSSLEEGLNLIKNMHI